MSFIDRNKELPIEVEEFLVTAAHSFQETSSFCQRLTDPLDKQTYVESLYFILKGFYQVHHAYDPAIEHYDQLGSRLRLGNGRSGLAWERLNGKHGLLSRMRIVVAYPLGDRYEIAHQYSARGMNEDAKMALRIAEEARRANTVVELKQQEAEDTQRRKLRTQNGILSGDHSDGYGQNYGTPKTRQTFKPRKLQI
ncbi:hypothetical protein M1563_04950 [Patescibacteria group bacterium]|nr:hypothetical protein [Patescibacteria group bacterium]MCL5409450.1 hypothetical protein [Patescibacteria group bacterium]